jgi:uncharacterized LabA/DUF88 family protein
MTNNAFFIDLPNFYSRLLQSGLGPPKLLREYFLNWLDFDLLASSLSMNINGIWFFYSGERIGPSSERIEGSYLKEYIDRINYLAGITARDVNIRGEQREPIRTKCESCGKENISEYISEKGVDSSLIVHLFDTIDSWDTAFLLSGDADYVPAVATLRRKGKIVIGAGFRDASKALVRECYQYLDILDAYIQDDYLLFRLFSSNGYADKWFSSEVKISSTKGMTTNASKGIRFSKQNDNPIIIDDTEYNIPNYCISISCWGLVDNQVRNDLVKEIIKEFPNRGIEITDQPDRCGIFVGDINYYCIKGANRRIKAIAEKYNIQ